MITTFETIDFLIGCIDLAYLAGEGALPLMARQSECVIGRSGRRRDVIYLNKESQRTIVKNPDLLRQFRVAKFYVTGRPHFQAGEEGLD